MTLDQITFGVGVLFGLLGVGKFIKLVYIVQNPVRQARRFGMTSAMVGRLSLIVGLYLGLSFWQVVKVLAPLPNLPWVMVVDLCITAMILLVILGLYFENVAELNNRSGIGGASTERTAHLWRVLRDRGVSLFDMLIAVPVLLIHVYLQSAPQAVQLLEHMRF